MQKWGDQNIPTQIRKRAFIKCMSKYILRRRSPHVQNGRSVVQNIRETKSRNWWKSDESQIWQKSEILKIRKISKNRKIPKFFKNRKSKIFQKWKIENLKIFKNRKFKNPKIFQKWGLVQIVRELEHPHSKHKRFKNVRQSTFSARFKNSLFQG